VNTDAPLIICVATAGARATKEQNPAVPYSATEIANEIVRAAEAGAALAHVHARTPRGDPSQDVETFREIIERVRARTDIILELSLGTRGFTLEQSLAPLDLNPVMASFPMEIRTHADRSPSHLERGARLLLERRARPSFAVSSPEGGAMVLDLIERGLAGPVPCLVLSPERAENIKSAACSLLQLASPFDRKAHWWLMKGGKTGATQLALRALAIASGGHVRVGFEDHLRTYDDQDLAPSNAWFVEQMVSLARKLGRPVANAAAARTILQLRMPETARGEFRESTR
jgi:3-keto-5-aminohexanoate cleavage enzyme